jgi:aspartate/methionine/tyrosine aminotransferase
MYLNKVKGSPALQLVNLVIEKTSKGERIISLAIGEPTFETPDEIVEEAYKAMKKGETKYTSSFGIYEVRETIAEKVRKKNRINAETKNVLFTPAKYAVFASIMAIVNKRGQILTPDPGYFYIEPITLAGAKPVYYRLNDDFSLNIDEIKSKITDKTLGIIINTPANPTGKVYDEKELKELYEVCKDKKIYIISDEAYEDLVYDKKHFSIGSLEEKPDKVISIFSLSKSYSMTGWRAGYTVANENIISNINKLVENTMTCFPGFIQRASAYALKYGDKYIEKFREEFRKRRDFTFKRLKEMKNIEIKNIEGAFYAFPKYFARIKSVEISKRLLNEYNLALMPGISFGPSGEHHLRISFAGSMETLSEGFDRMEEFFSKF